MRIIIDIPKEFEDEYKGDMFKDFFSRVMCDVKKGTVCGNYEYETAEMFLKAFDESVPANRIMKQSVTYDYNKAIDDFVEKLKPIIVEKIKGWTNSDNLIIWCEDSIDKVAEQLKAGVNNGEPELLGK